jgi:hypothetical protein
VCAFFMTIHWVSVRLLQCMYSVRLLHDDPLGECTVTAVYTILAYTAVYTTLAYTAVYTILAYTAVYTILAYTAVYSPVFFV